jgi:carbonic anhydrase
MEEGEVHVFDVKSGQFVPASVASHSGDGPYPDHCCEPAFEPIFDTLSESLFNEIDTAYQPKQPARESTP